LLPGNRRKLTRTSLPTLVAQQKWACQAASDTAIMRALWTPNEVDDMVAKFRKTNPDFYNGYFAARVILNRAPSDAAPKPAGSEISSPCLPRQAAVAYLCLVRPQMLRMKVFSLKNTKRRRKRRKEMMD
jgi:hypothetical protein